MTRKGGHRAANFSMAQGHYLLHDQSGLCVWNAQTADQGEDTAPGWLQGQENLRPTKETTAWLEEAIYVSQTLLYMHYSVVNAFIPWNNTVLHVAVRGDKPEALGTTSEALCQAVAHVPWKFMASWGARVAQAVKRPTLDFGSGRDLGVVGAGPASGSMLGVEPA